MRRGVAIGVAVLTLACAATAHAAGDDAVARGKAVFNQCKACHSLKPGVTTVGPDLHGLFGRKAASLDSFEYSDAFYGADFVWDADHLAKWVANPAAMIPGTKMQFAGIRNPAQISDLIAFLRKATH